MTFTRPAEHRVRAGTDGSARRDAVINDGLDQARLQAAKSFGLQSGLADAAI